MNTRERLLLLLGLLEPSKTDHPSTIDHVETRGHWRVSYAGSTTIWECQCRRSKPLYVAERDISKLTLPRDGLHACEICREEAKRPGKSNLLKAWLNRNRYMIDKDQHLYLPGDLGYARDRSQAKTMRTRRYVYQVHYKKILSSEQYVLCSCSDEHCINPYHLCLSESPAQKVTPKARALVHRLQQKGVSAKVTKQILDEGCLGKLSLRCIQGLRKGNAESERSET